jgi:hypothetical protein
MSWALDLERVRSNVVLERTCHPSSKTIESLATELSGGSPYSVTPDRRALAGAAEQNAAADPAAQPRLP